MKDSELILQSTSGGLSVFKHYFNIKSSNKLFINEHRKDSNPSCKLYYSDRKCRYIMKDFGDSDWTGDCFTIVGKIKGLNVYTQFNEILRTIDNELGLFLFSSCSSTERKPRVIKEEEPLPKKSKPYNYTAELKDFTPSESFFWQQYGINPVILKKYHIESIRRCYFKNDEGKGFTVYGSEQQPVFGYFFCNGKGLKVYRPKSSNRFLYAGTLPNPYIFGMEQLDDTAEYVFITGGEKDVMTLASQGYNAISLNSETAKIPQELIRELQTRFKYIVFLYDSDETGKRESLSRLNEVRKSGIESVRRVVLPLSGTKKEKDISDFFLLGRTRSEFHNLVEQSIITNE